MNQELQIIEVIERNNSVLFQTPNNTIFYEKLVNTIHSGNIEVLSTLQEKAEKINYNPPYESRTLRKEKGKALESLLINVTESCNLSCSYCIYSGNYENERNETKLNMDFETAKKAVDLFMPLSNERILVSFYGGEPLNNMRLIKEIINYTKTAYPKKIPVFSMTTNFCDADNHIKDIIKNEIYINMSLDGPKKIHDMNRRFKNGRPTYEKIMKNLEKFQEIAPQYVKTYFSQNVTCNDLDDLPEILEFFQENENFNISRISRIETKGLKKDQKQEIKYPISVNFIKDYLNAITLGKDPNALRVLFDQNLKKIAIRDKETMPKELMLNGSCYPGNKKLFVDTEGSFYICEKFGRRLPIGNVDEGMNQKLIDETIDRFTQIRNNFCVNDCWAQRLCTPCIHSSKDPRKNISKEGLAQICDSNRSQILISLAIYTSLIKKDREMFKSYIDSIN